jgi:hypothetical protein
MAAARFAIGDPLLYGAGRNDAFGPFTVAMGV